MTIKDYSSTAASNTAINGISIAGTAPVSNMDDGLRNVMADISNWTDSDSLVSGSTTDLGSVAGMYVTVSGTATITSFGTLKAGMVKFVKFTGAGQITYNATSMVLPGAANITRADGDTAVFVSEGSGNWRLISYKKNSVSWETISSTTIASGSSSWSQASLSGYRMLRITGFLRTTTDSVSIVLETSTDNGSTWSSSASDYTYQSSLVADTTYTATRATAASNIIISGGNMGNTSAEGASFEIIIHNLNVASRPSRFEVASNWQDTSANDVTRSVTGRRAAATLDNAIRIVASSGTLAEGFVCVEGLPG